jgi:hypothetical protein
MNRDAEISTLATRKARDSTNRWSAGEKGRALESSGAFQPVEKHVILDVVFAALHSHQDLATRQSANSLLHGADARNVNNNIHLRYKYTEGG